MSYPLVSIQINCHNGEKYLSEAIDSIYKQTYKNWEIIFWDNASSDTSAKIAKSYDGKLRYFLNKKKKSLGEVRFLASKKAKGEFLAFLDCDDEWLPEKLENQLKCFENKDNLAVVYTNSEIINADSNFKYIQTKEELPRGNVFENLIKNNFIIFSSVMVDKKKFFQVGGFPKNFKNTVDYWLFLKLAEKFKFDAIDAICCKVKIHSNNLSDKQRVIAQKESIKSLKSFLPNKNVERSLKYHYNLLSIAYLKEGYYFQCIYTLFKYNLWFLFIISIYNKLIKIYLFRK